MSRRVALRIDELVLDGVEATPAVGDEVRAELARLLAERPPREGAAAARRTADLGPGRIGPAVARAVHRTVSP